MLRHVPTPDVSLQTYAHTRTHLYFNHHLHSQVSSSETQSLRRQHHSEEYSQLFEYLLIVEAVKSKLGVNTQHYVYTYCILLLYTTTVYYYCILLLYTTAVYYYCILLLYTTAVYYCCILLLYTTAVYYCCILLMYTTTVYYYCILLLYTTTVCYIHIHKFCVHILSLHASSHSW